MLAIDLFCGLGGWTEGFLSEGFEVVGFDIERHDYGTGSYRGQLVLQDVLTLHGSQFAGAACIVASPPCQAYSYRAMPWKRAKALPPPDNSLFEACFRIQREACEATCFCSCWRCVSGGHCVRCDCFRNTGKYSRYIPLVVENVRGAQKWVGRAKANFGSYYLWGDVAMVGRRVVAGNLRFGEYVQPLKAQKFNPDQTDHPAGSWFAIANSKNRGAHTKVPGFRFDGNGGSFQTASVKVAGLDSSSKHGTPGYKAQAFNATAAQRFREGVKFSQSGDAWFDGKPRDKMLGDKGPAAYGSKSDSRKAASAQIAKIPFPLAQHIARCFKQAVSKSH